MQPSKTSNFLFLEKALKAIKENVPFYDFNKVTTYDKKYEKFWNKNSYRFLSKDSFPEKLMNFSFTKIFFSIFSLSFS